LKRAIVPILVCWVRHCLNIYFYTRLLFVKSPGNWYGPSVYIPLFKLHATVSPLTLWIRISIRARCTTLCDKVCQWLTTGQWFSSGPPSSSANKTDRHDITELLLKVALNTIKQTKNEHI